MAPPVAASRHCFTFSVRWIARPSGKVWLNGRRLDTLGLDELAVVRRRHIGFIFQAFNLLPTLTVQENVSLPLLLDAVAESESRNRSASALATWVSKLAASTFRRSCLAVKCSEWPSQEHWRSTRN